MFFRARYGISRKVSRFAHEVIRSCPGAAIAGDSYRQIIAKAKNTRQSQGNGYRTLILYIYNVKHLL